MKKVLSLLFGILLAGIGIYGIFTGKTVGIGSSSSPLRIINIQDDFIEYCIVIATFEYIAFLVIKNAITDINQ